MFDIVYAGTPEFALPALAALLQSEHRVRAVYTQPDRPSGRGRRLQASPVKRLALEHGLELRQPQNFKADSEVEALRALRADLFVVAAYGLILPSSVLAAPRLGCLNIHASLLPRWRGAAPIQQAILAGDDQSGVTLMRMEQGLDTGAVVAQREIAIEPSWSAGDLHDALAPLGAELLIETLDDIPAALQAAKPQEHGLATYAPRLVKQQAEVDWSKPVQQLSREVRAYNPWPVSYTDLAGDNLRLWAARGAASTPGSLPGKVIRHDQTGIYVACADGALQITELQFAGRRRCTAAQALNARDLNGCRLGPS